MIGDWVLRSIRFGRLDTVVFVRVGQSWNDGYAWLPLHNAWGRKGGLAGLLPIEVNE